MQTHRPFLVLIAAFVCAVLAQMALLPPFEGGDESLHLAYTLTVANEGRLPERTESATNGARQASGQPPLYYACAALVVRVLNLATLDDVALWEAVESRKNLWYAPPDIWNQFDNRNVYLEAGVALPELTATLSVLRFVSLGFGLLGMIGAYGVADEVMRRRRWALVATAAFAFTPQYITMSAQFHNDIGAYALCALVLWQSLRVLRAGASTRRLLVLGALVGLAGLAKINTLLLAPAVAAALALEARRHGTFTLSLLRNGALTALPAIVFLGPWLAFGLLTVNDPLGTATHLRPGFFYESPLTLTEALPLVPEVYLGYWGKLASAVYLNPLIYTLLGSLIALAAAGYIVGARAGWWRGRLRQEQMLVLGLAALASCAGVLYWVQHIHFITGRLAYPAHAAFAVALAGGLSLLAGKLHRPRLFAGWFVAVLLFAGCIAAPVSLLAAYGPVNTHADIPADLTGNPLDFAPTPDAPAAIRFLGYRIDAGQISWGGMLRFRVCWQVLEGSPPPRPAAFALKVFTQAGEQVADRTSLIGMGRYPTAAWQPGDRVCDAVDLPITGMVPPGEVANVLLVLLDAETQAVNWEIRSVTDGQIVTVPLIGTLP